MNMRELDGGRSRQDVGPGAARRRGLALGLVTATLAVACSGQGGADDPVGNATIALANVPMDVGCVRIRAVGGRSVEHLFEVKPGQSSVLPLSKLPVGTVQFFGDAFDGSCAGVTGGTTPAWTGDPVSAEIRPGTVARVTLVLSANGRSQVTVDFQIDPATGAPCVGDEAGCLSPADTTGSSEEPLPEGARLVTPAEFGVGLAAGKLRLVSPRLEQQTQAGLQDQTARDRETLVKLLADSPDDLKRLLAEPAEDARLQRQGDGNYLFDLGGKGNPEEQVTLMGKRFTFHQAAVGMTTFMTPENQLGIYAGAFAAIPPDERARRQLPSPTEIAKLPADSLLQFNLRLASDASLIDILLKFLALDLPPKGFPASCGLEEGSPPGLPDQSGGSCAPGASNLFMSAHFPLKWRATCVKNQGHRGTCVSFGITGAAEAAIALKHNRWLNLSEEKLYYNQNGSRTCGDGLNTTGVLNDMVGSGYDQPWEYAWDYNPSSSRNNNVCPYTSSCVSYSGEHCSDTSHQGDLYCFNFLFFRFCGTDGSAGPGSGFKLSSSVELFSLFSRPLGLALGRLYVAAGIPLVISYDVTPSFDAKANGVTNGLVSYVGGESSRGGHASTVIGFIDNARLPMGMPAGSGGGYFIVKNSWGKCNGDGGYVYLPYDFVMTYAYSLSTVGVN
jgi:hypothetical protein